MEDRVREIIAKKLDMDLLTVVDEAIICDDLMADSLDCVELTMAFEEEFNIEIPDRDAERINTVAEAITYLQGVVK